MDAIELDMMNRFNTRKGQIVTLTTKRPMKMKKNQPVVEKTSTFQARIGVTFDNIATVKEKRQDGTYPEENQGLKGFEWVKFPILLKSLKTNEVYVRCTKVKSNVQSRTEYTMDGSDIEKSQVKEMALASEFPKSKSDSEVFNIKLSSIITLNG